MTKFMFLYNGPATDPADMSPEDAKAVMAKWGEWMEKLGPAMIDMGTPMGNGAAVVDDGSEKPAIQLNGYSIVEADDLAGAQAHAEGHPFLSDGTGEFSIEIFELLPTPGM